MTTKSTILAILGDHRDDVKEYFADESENCTLGPDMDWKIARLIEEIKELP